VGWRRARAVGFQPGDVQRHARLHHAGMLLGGLGDPGVHVGRLGRRQHDGLGQRQRVDAGLAHQLLQRQGLDAQVVLAGDLLRAGQVEPRLRLAAVGDGGVPTSKLRCAAASCWLTAVLSARTEASASCAASTSK
jgi:hypothetical protein